MIVISAGLLRAFGVSLVIPALMLGAAVFLWVAFRYPLESLGSVLAFMPIFPLAFIIAKFFGPAYIGSIEGCDRVVLLLLTVVLLWRNGVKLAAPDWFLLVGFFLAVVRLSFGGTLIGLLDDFEFMIAYAAGRVAALTASQEESWARRAVWIVAVLAILGMIEVFIIGEGPRGLLYMEAAHGGTDGQTLNVGFHADGYSGLRESATMFGPLQFANLCMAALIVWWVYCRQSLPAVMIAAGLVCTVTRSAWIGTAVAIPILASIMDQRKRLFQYAAVVLALFLAAIPILGLSDYLFSVRTGQEPSAQGHQESIFEGLEFVSTHALGVGPGNMGRYAVENNRYGFGVEDTYLTLAGEYGVATGFCFVGFLISSLWVVWHHRTRIGYVAVGVLVGFGTVMIFVAAHDVFSLATWIWFPVGLAVRHSVASQ